MYIVLEGIDGAGKSTQISLLKDFLEQNGLEVETVVEPTDSEVGKLIRKLLTRHDATSDAMQKTLGLLFAADRLLIMEKLNKLEEETSWKKTIKSLSATGPFIHPLFIRNLVNGFKNSINMPRYRILFFF